MVMNRAYVDANEGQAICCWDAPDKNSIEDLFSKVGVQTESIREVVEYSP